jgi:hypothetical protein
MLKAAAEINIEFRGLMDDALALVRRVYFRLEYHLTRPFDGHHALGEIKVQIKLTSNKSHGNVKK